MYHTILKVQQFMSSEYVHCTCNRTHDSVCRAAKYNAQQTNVCLQKPRKCCFHASVAR